MSYFDFEYICNDETELIAFNKKKRTKDEALKQARLELDTDNELEVFESYVQFGFWKAPDGEVYNSWYIKDMYEPVVLKTHNSVAVWCVKEKVHV